VISESGHGTGFFVDGKGLILTNQHVVAQSQYLAVQFLIRDTISTGVCRQLAELPSRALARKIRK